MKMTKRWQSYTILDDKWTGLQFSTSEEELIKYSGTLLEGRIWQHSYNKVILLVSTLVSDILPDIEKNWYMYKIFMVPTSQEPRYKEVLL